MSNDKTSFERLIGWEAALDTCSYYELLGVDRLAHESDIKAAYHRFARAFHPDSHLRANEEALGIARRVFQRGTEAYRALMNPELRVRYDMGLAKGRLRLAHAELDTSPGDDDTRPLHELCRSAGAKLCAGRATKLIDAGNLAAAKEELLAALRYDGGVNPAIQSRIEALDVILYAAGNET